MRTIPVAEFKTNFSAILKDVEKGEKIAISYGRKKEGVAMLVPFENTEEMPKRKLGLLQDKGASMKIMPDFEMTDEEVLNEKLYD
ncbi:MAG: type II toxin-antitoxin system Phd/YefM family antitoxin [Bacteroidetes bacterium]|jgi:antitoxin (DNA-binding transcriptional repressor) of toxin-antitoxin stability system|nr:MAG: type II toxin-antitoxin system Phd/YefM family antitoxin [Bacteroidota bacterium]